MMKRQALLSALSILFVSACNREQSAASRPVQSESEADPESGQGRALEAGRALIGKPAPAAVLTTIDGAKIDLASIYGRNPVYLKFWATWCIPCREQMPRFEADFVKYRDRLVTVAVDTGFNDNEAAVRNYRKRLGLTMPIAIDDGSLGAALNLRVTPQHVVIGRDGRILYVGHLDDDRLQAAIREAIGQPPSKAAPAPRASKPEIGGSIIAGAGFPLSGPVADRKARILVFFAPWCESYYKDSRPEYSKACTRSRLAVNRLAGSVDAHWLGIASSLWSSAKDLQDYRTSKDAYRIPLHLDSSDAAFRAFGVRDVPTVIVIDPKGRVVRRLGPSDEDLSDAVREVSTRT